MQTPSESIPNYSGLPNAFQIGFPPLVKIEQPSLLPTDLDLIPPDELALIIEFQKIMTKSLYKWSLNPENPFKFKLPSSEFLSSQTNQPLAIIIPNTEETFEHIPLSSDQLNSIWETRKFKVDSKIYSIGHIWQLPTRFFSSIHDRQKLFQKLLMIPNNLFHRYNDFFTVKRWYYDYKWLKKGPNLFSAFKNIAAFWVQLFDLFFGSPSYSITRFKHTHLPLQLQKILTNELLQGNYPLTKTLCEFIQQKNPLPSLKQPNPDSDISDILIQKSQFEEQTKIWETKNNKIKETQNKINLVFSEARVKWDEFYCQSLENMNDCDEIEYQLFCNNLLSSRNEFEANFIGQSPKLNKQIAEYLSIKLKVMNAIDVILRESQNELFEFNKKLEMVIRAKHPYLKRVTYWFNRKKRHMSQKFSVQQTQEIKSRVQQVLEQIDTESAEMWLNACQIEQKIEENKEKTWKSEKEILKQPAVIISIRRKIYPPYKVCKTFDYHFSKWSYNLQNINWIKINSDFFFFRVASDFIRYFYWSLNASYYSFRYAYSGEFGLLGLLMCQYYYRGYSIDTNGNLKNDLRKTEPIAHKFARIVDNALDSRRRFEARPDTGLLGKNVARIFNIINCYIVRIIFCAVFGCFIFHPILNILVIFAMLFYGVSSWLWMFLVILARNLCRWFIWDFESLTLHKKTPGKVYSKFSIYKSGRRLFPIFQIFFELIFNGFIQLFLSLIFPLIYPLLAFFIFFFSMIIYFFKFLSDFLVFTFILRCCGKVPSTNTKHAYRIAGPGISNNLYYSLSMEDVVLLIQSHLERIQLLKLKQEVSNIIDFQDSKCREILSRISKHVLKNETILGSNYIGAKEIEKENLILKHDLNVLIEKRIKELPVLPNTNLKGMGVKFNRPELEKTKLLCQNLLKSKLSEMKLDDFIWDFFDIKKGKFKLLTFKFLEAVFGGKSIFESADEADEKLVMKNSYEHFKERKELVDKIVKGTLLLEELKLESEEIKSHKINNKVLPEFKTDGYFLFLMNPICDLPMISNCFAKLILNLKNEINPEVSKIKTDENEVLKEEEFVVFLDKENIETKPNI